MKKDEILRESLMADVEELLGPLDANTRNDLILRFTGAIKVHLHPIVTPKGDNFLNEIITQFTEAYESYRGTPYVVVAKGKESAMASKLLVAYKVACPNLNSGETLIGMRKYFDLCVQIKDPWLYDNMSLSIIVNKYNEINTILRNGNQQRNSKGGATRAELDRLFEKIDQDEARRQQVG